MGAAFGLAALAVVVENKDANSGGKACIIAARLVYFDRKGVDGFILGGGDMAKGLPEFGFQRDGRAMAAQGERVFDGAVGHFGAPFGSPSVSRLC